MLLFGHPGFIVPLFSTAGIGNKVKGGFKNVDVFVINKSKWIEEWFS